MLMAAAGMVLADNPYAGCWTQTTDMGGISHSVNQLKLNITAFGVPFNGTWLQTQGFWSGNGGLINKGSIDASGSIRMFLRFSSGDSLLTFTGATPSSAKGTFCNVDENDECYTDNYPVEMTHSC